MKRTLAASAILSLLALVPIVRGGPAAAPTVFKLSVTGKNVQGSVELNPGVKPPTGPVNDKVVSEILKGTKSDFAANYVSVSENQSGSFYLIYVNKDEIRVADNPQGTNATVLHGRVDNGGGFMMFGKYHFTPIDLLLVDIAADVAAIGKVKFAPGSFTPKSISGTLYLSSTITGDLMTLKFKTVGAPL